MPIQVKICGITSAEAADAAARAGVDYAGLMFHPKSPRNLGLDQARALAERLRGKTRLVAVLADPDDARLAEVTGAVRPDYLQLHGGESAQRAGAIRSRFGIRVIKVIAVADAGDLANVAAYEDAADMLMFDTKAPAGAERPGGHGVAFDWQILRSRKFAKPWLLAGGLNAANVARAIAASGAPGVDASSGVETAPGVKSAALIADFVAAARNAHYETQQ